MSKKVTKIKLTQKQELFCIKILSGKNQSDAYREVYNTKTMNPETVWVNASRLMANAKVASRIEELRAPIIKRAQVTLDSHLVDLQTIRNGALANKQFGAAVNAEMARGQVAGLYVKKVDANVNLTKDPVLEVILESESDETPPSAEAS